MARFCLFGARRVEFRAADLSLGSLVPADIVTANLTGALLIREARTLMSAVMPDGTLVISGLLTSERGSVIEAFAPARIVWEGNEGEWIGLALRAPGVE